MMVFTMIFSMNVLFFSIFLWNFRVGFCFSADQITKFIMTGMNKTRLLHTPNDPYIIYQPYLLYPFRRLFDVLGHSSKHMYVPHAWSIWTGVKDQSCLIAILSTKGCNKDHPDLAGKAWYGKGPGMIESTYGYSFKTNSEDRSEWSSTRLSIGTLLSLAAAAGTNNGIGGSTVHWNCKYMCLTLNRNFVEYKKALKFAADEGAWVSVVTDEVKLKSPIERAEASKLLQYLLDKKHIVVQSPTLNGSNVREAIFPSMYSSRFLNVIVVVSHPLVKATPISTKSTIFCTFGVTANPWQQNKSLDMEQAIQELFSSPLLPEHNDFMAAGAMASSVALARSLMEKMNIFDVLKTPVQFINKCMLECTDMYYRPSPVKSLNVHKVLHYIMVNSRSNSTATSNRSLVPGIVLESPTSSLYEYFESGGALKLVCIRIWSDDVAYVSDFAGYRGALLGVPLMTEVPPGPYQIDYKPGAFNGTVTLSNFFLERSQDERKLGPFICLESMSVAEVKIDDIEVKVMYLLILGKSAHDIHLDVPKVCMIGIGEVTVKLKNEKQKLQVEEWKSNFMKVNHHLNIVIIPGPGTPVIFRDGKKECFRFERSVLKSFNEDQVGERFKKVFVGELNPIGVNNAAESLQGNVFMNLWIILLIALVNVL